MKIRYLMIGVALGCFAVADAPRRARMRTLAVHHLGAEAGCRNALANLVPSTRHHSETLTRYGLPLTRAEEGAYWRREREEHKREIEAELEFHSRLRREYERAWYWSWLTGVEPDPPEPSFR